MALDTIFKGKPSILISAWEIYQYIHCIQDTCIKKPTYYLPKIKFKINTEFHTRACTINILVHVFLDL